MIDIISGVKNDFVFKNIFGTNKNIDIIKDFLEGILGEKITEKISVEKEVELEKLTKKNKSGRLDVKVKVGNKKIINIELQLRNEGNMEKRSSFYAGKLMSRSIDTKSTYNEIPEIIMINILDFKYIEGEKYHNETVTVLKDNKGLEINNVIKHHYIELPKYREKKKKDIRNKEEQWLLYIDGREKERIDEVMRINEKVRRAYEEEEYLTGKEEKVRIKELLEKWEIDRNSAIEYATQKGKLEGRKEGKIEGKIEGKKEGKIQGKIIGIKEVAKKMVEDGIDIERVAKITGLKKEEIIK